VFDESAKEIQRIERIAEMLTNLREYSREEVKGKLEVHFEDLEANLQGYIAERIDLLRAFIVELLMRPYGYHKRENGLHLLAYEVEGTIADLTEMLENIMVTVHEILEQTEDF
jgi:signal transduction histidine kinase